MVVLAPEYGEKDEDGFHFIRIVGVTGRPSLNDVKFNTLAYSVRFARCRSPSEGCATLSCCAAERLFSKGSCRSQSIC